MDNKNPFDSMTIDDCKQLLIAIDNNFAKFTQNNVVVSDYFTGYFQKYQELIYFVYHEKYLINRYRPTTMMLGGIVYNILKDKLNELGEENSRKVINGKKDRAI